MKQLFFKHPNRELNEQTIVRLTFSDDEEGFKDTEMLIAGYIMNTGMRFGIYDLKFNEQSLLSTDDYRRQWHAIQSWLTEIDEDEFIKLYYDATALMLKKTT